MKTRKLILLFIVVLCCSFNTTGSLTDAERNTGIKYLTETQTYLLNAVNGLSDEQAKFKSSPDRWSALECVEHMVNTEILVYQMTLESIKEPVNPEKRSEIKFTDEQLIAAVVDRSKKVKAPEVIQPTGKYATLQAAIDAFKAQREKTIEYLKTTPDNLRDHVRLHPALGMLDAYQFIILTGAHQKRHTLQLEEVKADKNFPKK